MSGLHISGFEDFTVSDTTFTEVDAMTFDSTIDTDGRPWASIASAAAFRYARICPIPTELQNTWYTFFTDDESSVRKMTQPERILAVFAAHGYVCGHALYRAYMPNGRNRIGEMERDGRLPVLVRVPCPNDSRFKHYVIADE